MNCITRYDFQTCCAFFMYTAKTDPLEPEEKIKVRITIKDKKPEIKWEAFSEDMQSLGTGLIKLK